MYRLRNMFSGRISSIAVLVLVVAVALAHRIAQARPHDDQSDGGNNSARASQRLMKELKDFYKSDSYKQGVFAVELVDDNIYKWNVKLFINDPENPLHDDLQELKEKGGQDYVLLEVTYSDDYPIKPPFVRVVSPYLGPWIQPGGALCLELLSESGWDSAYTIEPLILSIAADRIYGCRVEMATPKPYTYENAKKGFDDVLSFHVKKGQWS